MWILLKQETLSGSGISWAICKSAPRSRQITTPAPHHSVFYRPDAFPVAQRQSTLGSGCWKMDNLSAEDVCIRLHCLLGIDFSILQPFVGFQVIDAEPGTERDQV